MTAPVTLIVIAKSPRPGLVKTRLCPPCTPDDAARLAAAALADTLDTVAATPAAARVLALDGPRPREVPAGFVVVPQSGRGLDERLTNAFAAVTGPALLVGMDTPQVSVGVLTDAAAALGEPGTDAVLGPAVDGGWWSIGLAHPDGRVFTGVPMSTPHTGRDQQARLDDLGYRTSTLTALRDFDTFADACAVATLIPNSRFAKTMATLDHHAAALE